MDFFKKLYSYLYFQSWRRGLWTPPDRKILTDKILSYFNDDPRFRKILFVGVQDYCASYKDIFTTKDFVTIEPDPHMAKYGAKHHIPDFLENLPAHFDETWRFDAIVVNGVIGYGLNEQVNAEHAMAVCHDMLSSNGVLVVGINPENTGHVRLNEISSLQEMQPWTLPSLGVSSLNVPFKFHKNLSHSFYFYTRNQESSL